MFSWSFLFSPVFLGLILRVLSFHVFYTIFNVSFTHLFTNGIIVNCFCTVHEGLMLTVQEGQVAWLAVSNCSTDGSLFFIIASVLMDLIYTICLEKSLLSLWSSCQVSFNLKSYFALFNLL